MKNKIPTLLTITVLLLGADATYAGSATWNLNPTTGDWNTTANWTPATVPNGGNQTATFAVSNTTAPSVSDQTVVNGVVFRPGASAFTVTVLPTFYFTVTGTGIENDSGITQTFVTAADSGGTEALLPSRTIQLLEMKLCSTT